MDQKKQIDIIESDIKTGMEPSAQSNPRVYKGLNYRDAAEFLYRVGYRKQSEWISVEERLPQVTGKYICGVKDKDGNTWTVPADWSLEMKRWFGEFGEIKNTVTHWMPLPEPPKMKGGEE